MFVFFLEKKSAKEKKLSSFNMAIQSGKFEIITPQSGSQQCGGIRTYVCKKKSSPVEWLARSVLMNPVRSTGDLNTGYMLGYKRRINEKQIRT